MYDEKKRDPYEQEGATLGLPAVTEKQAEIPKLVSQQLDLIEQLTEIIDIINGKLDSSVLRDGPIAPGTQDQQSTITTTTHLGHRLGNNNECIAAQIDKLRLINNRLEV